MWAAEWWRCNHEQGPWRWEDMLQVIGCGSLAPGSPGYPLLCRMVARGLAEWRRPLLRVGQSRAFLVTIACEGGLPLKMVRREQGSLRRYFRALLEEFRIYGRTGAAAESLAERTRGHLPRSLRQDVVFQVSGRLIAKIWELQAELGESRTPVRDLDDRHHGWRNELPLRLPDDLADALLNSLLLDAAALAKDTPKRIRWRRSLQASPAGWEIIGELRLPATLDEADLRAMLELPADTPIPGRFDLCLRPAGGAAELVALATERPGRSGEATIALEHGSRASRPVRGVAACVERSLVLRDGREERASTVFPGAAALTDLPWVFAGAGPGEAAERYECVGQGSTTVRAVDACVAAPPGTRAEPGASARCECVGSLPELDRTLYRISGSVTFVDAEGGRTVVRTGAGPGAGEVEYLLDGRRRELGRDRTPVFEDPPTLLERQGEGASLRVPARDLVWKPDGPSSAWTAFSATSVGDGRLRYVAAGEIRFSAPLKILPRGATVRYHPGASASEGVIELAGFGADEVLVLAPGSLAWVREPGAQADLRVRVSAPDEPPFIVELELRWGTRSRLRLTLPFPSRGGGFFLPSDQRLPSDACVALGRLPGIRAVVLVPRHDCSFHVEGTFRGREVGGIGRYGRYLRAEMREVAHGHFEYDASGLQREIQGRLDESGDDGAYVRLRLHSNEVGDIPLRTLRVTRYDLEFEVDAGARTVALSVHSLVSIAPDEVEALQARAYPLLDPVGEAVDLVRRDARTWEVPEAGMGAGPWLVLGWQGDWCRVRPLMWQVPRPEEEPAEAASSYTFAAVCERERVPERWSVALRDVANALGADPGHPDWKVVDGLVDWTERLPASTFALLRALSQAPQAAAMAALRIDTARFDLLWDALESLPFWWRLVPRSAWSAAAASWVRELRAALAPLEGIAGLPPAAEMLREQFAGTVARVTARLPCLKPVFGFTRGTLLGEKVGGEAGAVVRPEIREEFLKRHRAGVTDCPVFGIASRELPVLDDARGLVESLRAVPESERLWIGFAGRFATPERFTFVNAPTIAALAA
ncbi:MAG TPA: STY4851/ECs_5259 family protein, partial [Longimicrobiaceae bacterium]|nr:STY4851/ECs_5259 family protein [Longimicrobiaceae bacterium]